MLDSTPSSTRLPFHSFVPSSIFALFSTQFFKELIGLLLLHHEVKVTEVEVQVNVLLVKVKLMSQLKIDIL